MERIASIAHSFEEAERAEKEYYQRLTPLERLAIMLELNKRWSESAHAEVAPDSREFIALLNSNSLCLHVRASSKMLRGGQTENSAVP